MSLITPSCLLLFEANYAYPIPTAEQGIVARTRRPQTDQSDKITTKTSDTTTSLTVKHSHIHLYYGSMLPAIQWELLLPRDTSRQVDDKKEPSKKMHVTILVQSDQVENTNTDEHKGTYLGQLT